MTRDIEEQLRQAILTAGMTRYRLAQLSGVSEGLLSHFVNRNRTMTLPTAGKVARVLGLELTQAKEPAKTPAKKTGKGR